MRPPTPTPAPTFALNPNPRYTHALSGCVVNVRFPGVEMARVLDCRWLGGGMAVVAFAVLGGCGDDEQVVKAEGVWLGVPGTDRPYFDDGPQEGSDLQPGDAARVVAFYDCLSTCSEILETRCEAIWGANNTLLVNASWVYRDTSGDGRLFGGACHNNCLNLEADCGEVVVPEGPMLRTLLNGEEWGEAPIPVQPQVMRGPR